MKILEYALISILFTGCSGKIDDKDVVQKAPPVISEEQWTVYNNKDSIPELLNNALVNLHKGHFELANPNERFNATDNIIDSLPRQQLSLLSRKGIQWRLAYIQGGFGKYTVYAQCEIKNDSIYNLSIAESLLSLEHNDSIDKYIAENILEPRYVQIIP